LQGYAYVTPFDAGASHGLRLRQYRRRQDILARLHRADVIGDVFGGKTDPRGAAAVQGGRPRRHRLSARRHRRRSGHGDPARRRDQSEAARIRQWREIGLGAQILKDLGISSIRLLTSAKLTYVGLGGFGIEIVIHGSCDGRSAAFPPPAPWHHAPGIGEIACASTRPPSQCCCGGWLGRPHRDRAATLRRPGARRRSGQPTAGIPVDVELVLAVDISYSMDGRAGAAARGLCAGADLARVSQRGARGHPRQGRRDLFRMGRAASPAHDRAMAGGRRPGSAGSVAAEIMRGADPPRLAPRFPAPWSSARRCSTPAAIAVCAG
jgi:hypothetical protein